MNDVCCNSSEKELEEVTKWMNENIFKDKIVLEKESVREEIKFIDLKVNVIEDHTADDEDLIPANAEYVFVKDRQPKYLSPKSCHPKKIAENIPVVVANRFRTSYSDSINDDQLIKDALIQYKAFWLKSGYNEHLIDKKFINYVVEFWY